MNNLNVEVAYIKMLKILVRDIMSRFTSVYMVVHPDLSAAIVLDGKEETMVFTGRMTKSIFGLDVPRIEEVKFNEIGL